MSQTLPLPQAGGGRGGQRTFQPRNTDRAQELRNGASPPERFLWAKLRARQLDGHKFSRQMPVGPFFADFVCREHKLVVELDGASHDARQDEDAKRDMYFIDRGFRVLRFQNAAVMTNLEGVLSVISEALNAHPRPLPQAGGGK
jgi:very-short-patch-repair endonuclease